MLKYKYPLLAAFLTALIVGGYFFFRGEEPQLPQKQQKAGRNPSVRSKRSVRKSRGLVRFSSKKRVDRVAVPASKRPKPVQLMLDDEEAKLTALGRQILAEIRAALDAEDFSTLSGLVARLASLSDNDLSLAPPGGLVHLRRAAISALGWFGAQSVPELAGFLADGHEEVREVAEEQFRLALEDIELGDYDRARIIVEAAKVVTSDDFLDMLMMEIGGSMRNSVAISTIVEVFNSGTAEAKAKIPEITEFVTGEDNAQTVEYLVSWLERNPDGPDNDLYGTIREG